MTSTRVLAILALVAPLTAAAQVSYYRDSYACNDRNHALWERKARLDRDQRDIDREGARLEHMKAQLEVRYRRLDWGDDVAIGDYNRDSIEYNRLIDAHNRRVMRMNGAAAVLNGDSQDLVASCGGEVVTLR